MHYKGFDLNLLVVLDALLEEESVSKAALRLNVSQPAISAALAKLRWHTGDEILEKVGRSARLTPRAQGMIKPVREILLEAGSLVKGEAEFDPKKFDRDFAISMTSYGAQVILPDITARLRKVAPLAKCTVEDIAFDSVTRVKSGELDFCVTFLQTRLLNPREDLNELSHAHLFGDSWVLVGCASNPKLTDDLDFADFRKMPYIETRPGGVPSLAERSLDEITERPRPSLSVPSFGQAIRNVIGSECVTITPSLTIDGLVSPLVKIVQPPFKIPDIDEFLVWHSRNEEDDGHRFCRELILESTRHLRKAAPDGDVSKPDATSEVGETSDPAAVS